MLTFIPLKIFGLLYSRVGTGAGAASKVSPGAGAALKLCGSASLVKAYPDGGDYECFVL
jgi:hypothetical protein